MFQLPARGAYDSFCPLVLSLKGREEALELAQEKASGVVWCGVVVWLLERRELCMYSMMHVCMYVQVSLNYCPLSNLKIMIGFAAVAVAVISRSIAAYIRVAEL